MTESTAISIRKVKNGFVMHVDTENESVTHIFHDEEQREMVKLVTESFGLTCVDWSDDESESEPDKKETPAEKKQLDENSV